jgi:hypothetical protein
MHPLKRPAADMLLEGRINGFDVETGQGTISRSDEGDIVPFERQNCNKTIRKRLSEGAMPAVAFRLGFEGTNNSGLQAVDVKGRGVFGPQPSLVRMPDNAHVDRVVKAKLRSEFPGGPKVSQIVRYYNENWEEIEDIIDPKPVTPLANPIVENSSLKEFLALGLFNDRLRLVRLTADGKYSFVDAQNDAHLILYPTVFPELELSWAIEEFEQLLNSRASREADFQRFFERNPEFILDDEHGYAHPHITLMSDDGSELIPDFVLQPVNQLRFCDLLELKLPTTNLFVFQKNRHRYSAAVEEAAAQLRTYAAFFDDKSSLLRFTLRYPHLNIYKPRMFVIIGRDTPEMMREKQIVRRALPDLNLKTYDDLLVRMHRRKELLQKRPPLIRF